jgi:hypothetical protein
MPDDLFAVPIKNQNDIRPTVTGHHLCHIDAPPLISSLRARLSGVAHAFCQKTRIGFDQQIVFFQKTINALSVDRQSGDKSQVSPNSSITPKRMLRLDNPNLLEQDRSASTLTAARRRDDVLPIVFFKLHRQFSDHRFEFSFSRSSLVCCCAFCGISKTLPAFCKNWSRHK